MTLPTMLRHDRGQFMSWCRGIDGGAWHSLAVPERITYTSGDLMVELSAAAVLTERARLVTTIIALPMHDAVWAAKRLATVDVLCDGRLTVGVGVGGRDHDYRAVSASMQARWQRLDDQVATMRHIWAGQPPFDGADPVGPVPIQPGGPPLLAGALGPKAMARAAHWADGVDGAWSMDGDHDTVSGAFRQIEAAWVTAGRSDRPHLSTSLWFALGPGSEERLRRYAYEYMKVFGESVARSCARDVVIFDERSLLRAVDNIDAAGADELFLVPTTADPVELDRLSGALGL